MGKNEAAFAGCNGTNTNLYVIVTKVKKETPKPAAARLLQGELPDMLISFSAWAGEDNARLLSLVGYTLAALALAVFSL